MSFPRYPAYKDSGVEWLGRLPAHWRVLPCRAVAQERTDKNQESRCSNYLSLLANIGVMPYEEKGDIGNKKPEDLSKCKLVARGDFVINSMNYGIGSYGESGYDGVCSPVYIVLKPNSSMAEPRFLFRILENRAFQTYAQSFGNGILEHRCAINWSILRSICVGVPPREEQVAILSFLDRETAKIDTLIAEQERLIELLQEKRQAVISHAVTKGLNPDVPMKPSGVEWLGDVPAHWMVGKCGFYANVLSGFAFPSERFSDDESNCRLLRGINVGVGVLKWEETVYWRREPEDGLERFILREGDLVLGMDRPIISDGVRVARLIKSDLPCLLLQRVARISPDSRMHPRYLELLISTPCFCAHVLPETTGVSVPHISAEQIADFVVPVPPFEEQGVISAFVEDWVRQIESLIRESHQATELLRERRSALISAAVTGQIDVRGLVEQEAA